VFLRTRNNSSGHAERESGERREGSLCASLTCSSVMLNVHVPAPWLFSFCAKLIIRHVREDATLRIMLNKDGIKRGGPCAHCPSLRLYTVVVPFAIRSLVILTGRDGRIRARRAYQP